MDGGGQVKDGSKDGRVKAYFMWLWLEGYFSGVIEVGWGRWWYI